MRRILDHLSALVLAGVLLAPAHAADAEPHPMTPQDLWSIQRPSNVAVSPDGRSVAYQMTSWDLEKNSSNTDLWSVPLAGGPPVRLTWQPGRDASPQWSADGRSLYFISARQDEPAQVYKLSMEGGEAMPVTDLPGGVTGFALAAKSEAMLVASTSYKHCRDLACVRSERQAREQRVATGTLVDELLYRHWDSWRGDERSHVYLVAPGASGDPIDLTPGNVDCPPVSLGSSHDFALSPDGTYAVLVVNRSKLVAASTDNDVELVELKSGVRRVLSPGDGSDSEPRFVDGGGALAWGSMARAGYESDHREILVAALDGKAFEADLPTQPELSVGEFLPWEDGRGFLLTAEEGGRRGLYLAKRGAERIELLVRGGKVGSIDLTPDGKTAVFVLESFTTAPEIHRVDLATREVARITSHSDALMASLELGKVEELRYNGADGDPIHAWVVHPPASLVKGKPKVPVLWLIHGGPQGAWLDDQHPRWNVQQFAALGYVAVALNVHGSTGYGQAFTDSINQDWGGKPFDDLLLGLEAARAKLPGADLDRVCAAGGSYGGYMVNWLLGHAGDRFRCFVSHAGVYDLRSMYGATEELWFPEWDLGGTFWTNAAGYERWSPSASAQSFRTPTLVIHGQLDFRVPVTQGMQLFTALQRQGVPSKLLYYPDEGHWVLSPANAFLWWSEIDAWLETWLDAK